MAHKPESNCRPGAVNRLINWLHFFLLWSLNSATRFTAALLRISEPSQIKIQRFGARIRVEGNSAPEVRRGPR
jgi:hypothetical protein